MAELSSAFTGALLGIGVATRTDHAAYLAGYCRLRRARPSALWTVASKAQAATDYLADTTQSEATDAERNAA